MTEGRLPTFLLAGVERAGTTTLARYLDAHPDVHIPPAKELHHFDAGDGDLEAYRARFRHAGDARAVGDATPSYLFHAHAIRAIARDLPTAAIVVSLRDPLARAQSHHRFATAWGLERRPFAEAVVDELDGRAPVGAEYLARGLYAHQLEQLDALHPTARVHVALLEDLQDDPKGTVRRMYRFLGLEDREAPDIGTFRNRALRPRSRVLWRLTSRWRPGPLGPVSADERPSRSSRMAARIDGWNTEEIDRTPLPPRLRRAAVEYVADDVARLSDRLGRDLSHWLTVGADEPVSP